MYEGEWNDICEYCDNDRQRQPQEAEAKVVEEVVMLCRHCSIVAHTRCARALGFERYVYDDTGEEDWVCDTCYPQLYTGASHQYQQPQKENKE